MTFKILLIDNNLFKDSNGVIVKFLNKIILFSLILCGLSNNNKLAFLIIVFSLTSATFTLLRFWSKLIGEIDCKLK